LPVPVGPRSRNIPAGRPRGARPAWYVFTVDAIPVIAVCWPTILRDYESRMPVGSFFMVAFFGMRAAKSAV